MSQSYDRVHLGHLKKKIEKKLKKKFKGRESKYLLWQSFIIFYKVKKIVLWGPFEKEEEEE